MKTTKDLHFELTNLELTDLELPSKVNVRAKQKEIYFLKQEKLLWFDKTIESKFIKEFF